jgi:dsDNA-specific endonuclease/ATPase MutS2
VAPEELPPEIVPIEPDDMPPVIVPIEDSLDLHAFAPRDVMSVVEEYLTQAVAHGLHEVRLIHGRGKGVQRAMVRSRLANHPLVVRCVDAPPSQGGWGATIALLRAEPAEPSGSASR